MKNTVDQITRLFIGLIDQLETERAEIEALRTDHQRLQEEVVRKNAQLIQERTAMIGQVTPMRVEREDVQNKMKEAERIKAIAKEEMETAKEIQKKAERKLIDLDEREALLRTAEAKTAKVITQGKELEEKILIFEQTKNFITKQQELLDEKQQSLSIREKALKIKEERMARLYADV